MTPVPLRRSVTSRGTYTVKPGDTAWKIALNHGITLEKLEEANPSVRDWNLIQVGQVLNLPHTGNGGHPKPPPSGPPSGAAQVTKSLAVHNLDLNKGSAVRDVYSTFQGDGSLSSHWPAKSQWVSFNAMWNHVQSGLGGNCAGGVKSNSAQETKDIRDAILQVSAKSLIDPRFVLAIVLQESNGCVRVSATTSHDGIHNPGIMQTSDGVGSCNDGTAVVPCPRSEIYQMILDGVGLGGNNLVKALNGASSIKGLGRAEEAQAFYRAARMYNSGFFSFQKGADLGQDGALECYASDIANRLHGRYLAHNSCWLNHG